jgi:drug/metabolite transporter (DMT)-like permease
VTATTPHAAADRETANVLRGLMVITVAMLIVPCGDVLAKLLTSVMSGAEVAFGRFLAQLVATGLFGIAIGEGRRLIPPSFAGHVLRSLFLAATALLFFSALAVMPLTDALAIAFVEPMILTALSALLLGETVDRRQWAACGVGFLGTLMIIRPSFQVFGVSALLPLASAFTFAGYHLMTRRLSGEGSLVAQQFATGLVGTVSLGLALIVGHAVGFGVGTLVWPGPREWGVFAMLGVLSFGCHAMVIRAFSLAPAAVLAPFGYLEIVSATALGYLVFGDFPALPTWAGIALIVGSGVYIAHQEAGRARPVVDTPAEH